MDVAALGLSVDSSQAEKGTLALDRLAMSAAKAEQSAGKMGATIAKTGHEAAASTSAMSDAAEQLGIDITGAAKAVEAAADRVGTALGRQRAAVNDNARSVGLARSEWTNLSRQLQDVGTMLASGSSPMQVVATQGAQIYDIFSSSQGGASAALRDFGATALRVATHPVTLLTAGLGAAALAAYQFAQQQTALERALNGAGRLSGATAGGLRDMAAAQARGGGLSYGQAVDAAAQYAGAGIGVENIPTLLASSQRFAHAFGVDLQDARDEITQMVGSEGLGALEKRFGPVSFATKEWVRSLEASGRYAEATAAKARLLDEETRKAKDTASELSKAWEGVIRWATTPVFGLGQKINAAIHGPTLEQQLAAARGDYFYLHAQRRGDASSYPGEAAAEQRVRDLERQLQEQRDRPARERRDLELKRLSQRAGDIVDAANPDNAQLRQWRESRDVLRQLVGSDGGLVKLADRADDARQTLANLENQIASWSNATDRIREDSALAVREITARTFAEREAVAMDRARIQVLRESGDAAKAAASAEAESAKMRAESARQVEDLLRTSRDSAALARASNSLERRMMEINIAERDFRRENIPNGATPMAREFDTAATAARNVASALDGLAAKIGRSNSNVVPFTPRDTNYSAIDPRGLSAYIRERAGAYGIDPETALRVARSEGLRNPIGDNGTSFGAFQLHVGGGVGDEFRRATGLDPSDPANERATIDYALKIAAQRGWAPYHGAARVGVGQWEGISGKGAANDNLSARTSEGYAAQRDTAQYEARIKPQEDFAKSIIASRDALEARIQTLGMDQRAVDEATKRQELMNEAIRETGNILPEQQRWIDANAASWADYQAKLRDADRDQRRYIEGLDLARGSLNDSLGGGIKALAHGQPVGAALEQSMSSAMDRLIDMQVGRFGESALGAMGSANGGWLGQLLGFGKQNVAQANIQAGIVNLTGGIGGIATGAAGGGGGLLGFVGSLLGGGSSATGLPTMAQGGMGPDLPGNAGGTDYWRGGATWVGENGPEIVNLPRGSQVIPHEQSLAYQRSLLSANQAAPTGSHPPTQVTFNNAPQGEADVRETRRRDGGVSLEVTFKRAVKKMISDGSLDREFGSSYGVRRGTRPF
jgi:hypothetical protein